MEFHISQSDLTSVFRQILQGQKRDSPDLVDMTAERSTLLVVVTGRSIEVPIEPRESGSFSIPIPVLFKLKKISRTYNEQTFRVRVSKGRFRLQNMNISNPEIKPRTITRRIIEMPDDARPRDLLSLPLLFSVEEIEDCGLGAKVLEAQENLRKDIEYAAAQLGTYGIESGEIRELARQKMLEHSKLMHKVLFGGYDAKSKVQTTEGTMAEINTKSADLLERCLRAWRRNDWERACRVLMDAISLEPDNPELAYWMGRLCDDVDEFSWAMELPRRDLPLGEEDARSWFRKAAQLGLAEMQYRMAEYWWWNPEEESSRRIQWLREASLKAHGKAQLELAKCLLYGHGTSPDYEEGLFWVEQADSVGLCSARDMLEEVRRETRMKQCEAAVNSGDTAAFVYAEWADRSQFEFFIGWCHAMFTDELMGEYREKFPDRKLGDSEWWKLPLDIESAAIAISWRRIIG